MFHLEINFGWSEQDIKKMSGHIVTKRIKQLKEWKKDNSDFCPFLSNKQK